MQIHLVKKTSCPPREAPHASVSSRPAERRVLEAGGAYRLAASLAHQTLDTSALVGRRPLELIGIHLPAHVEEVGHLPRAGGTIRRLA